MNNNPTSRLNFVGWSAGLDKMQRVFFFFFRIISKSHLFASDLQDLSFTHLLHAWKVEFTSLFLQIDGRFVSSKENEYTIESPATISYGSVGVRVVPCFVGLSSSQGSPPFVKFVATHRNWATCQTRWCVPCEMGHRRIVRHGSKRGWGWK